MWVGEGVISGFLGFLAPVFLGIAPRFLVDGAGVVGSGTSLVVEGCLDVG